MNKCLQINQLKGSDKPKTKASIIEAEVVGEGDLEVKVHYSSINYKDALAVTGSAPIIRSFPLVPGIDLCGEVISSDNKDFAKGDRVLATGSGLGEKYNGGYTGRLKLKSRYATPMPDDMTFQTAMALGTAGFTAKLCVNAITNAGITPDAGTILVTGASGGVGGVAVKILAAKGYEVAALTSEQGKTLATELGAKQCIMREAMSGDSRPMEEQKWAGAVDTVGGKVLARILAETNYGGVVAACGLAGGMDLSTTVMPFILRGVRLQGIDSVYFPHKLRANIWQELAKEFDAADVGNWTSEISLEQVPEYSAKLLAGEVKGRILVNLQK